jgi:molybdopterin-binding protein
MSEVRIDVSGSEFVAALPGDSVSRLDLGTGDRVSIVVRKTDVTRATGPQRIDYLTTRNQVRGKVPSIVVGSVRCEVHVAAGGDELVAVVTRYGIERLGPVAGDDVIVVVKATDVGLVVD